MKPMSQGGFYHSMDDSCTCLSLRNIICVIHIRYIQLGIISSISSPITPSFLCLSSPAIFNSLLTLCVQVNRHLILLQPTNPILSQPSHPRLSLNCLLCIHLSINNSFKVSDNEILASISIDLHRPLNKTIIFTCP